MARKDALLRLHERMIAIRDSLRKKMSEDMNSPIGSGPSGGDVGDAANDGEQTELNSQLAALESRELAQIERAIELIRDGRYGTCEVCSHKIPIARLKALPYTLLCVDCQREQEEHRDGDFDGGADWESVFRELTIGDIDVD